MSSRNRVSVTLIIILSIIIFSMYLPHSYAWTPTEITSNPNNESAPIIDGNLDDSWNTIANRSIHEFPADTGTGRRIELYVQHVEDLIYFLIEVKFDTAYNTETISLYLSNSTNETNTGDVFDKKQITLFNSTNQGNESSAFTDYYLDNEGIVIPDAFVEGFNGAARIGNGTDTHRYYEFEIQFEPSNESYIEDSTIKIFEKLSLKVGINNTANDEVLSEEIFIQVGPKSLGVIDDFGEYIFNTELYMMIVLISVSVLFGIYGIVLISLKSKVGIVKEVEGKY